MITTSHKRALRRVRQAEMDDRCFRAAGEHRSWNGGRHASEQFELAPAEVEVDTRLQYLVDSQLTVAIAVDPVERAFRLGPVSSDGGDPLCELLPLDRAVAALVGDGHDGLDHRPQVLLQSLFAGLHPLLGHPVELVPRDGARLAGPG